MGRLTDARRRARRAAQAASPELDAGPKEAADRPAAPIPQAAAGAPVAGAEPSAPLAGSTSQEQPASAHAAAVAVEPPAEPGPRDSAEAALVFPDDEVRSPARYVLPSSGLAEDILAAAEAGPEAVAAGETGLVEVASGAEIAAPAARAHQFTFFAAPERETREQVEATEHLVTFLVGAEEYGVDVRLVQEIIRVPAVTAVPRAPAFVRGVVNLRGRIIPVIDLKTKLGLGQVDAAQRRARVVVVRLKGRLVGLLVDGASQVLKVPVSVIEAAPEEVVEVESHFLRGVAKLHGRLIMLVDLLEVLAPELRADGAAP